MSKTFKTHPAWVKIPKNPALGIEYHNHESGICDIDAAPFDEPFYWQRQGCCGYNVNYYAYNGGFYSRPRRGQNYRLEFEGRMRANWRKTKHDLLKLSGEDLEDYDVKTYQHRHSALWEIW